VRRTDDGRRGTQLAALLLHSVLVQVVTFVLRPTSTYRALELGVPPTWLGVLSASFAIAPLLLAVPSGQAVDRFGERRVMLLGGLLLCTAAAAFVMLGGSIVGLVAASVLLGTGHLCCVVGQQALVANATPAGRHDAAFGYYTFAASLGQSLGPGVILLFGGTQTIVCHESNWRLRCRRSRRGVAVLHR
jgi:MFS family permease